MPPALARRREACACVWLPGAPLGVLPAVRCRDAGGALCNAAAPHLNTWAPRENAWLRGVAAPAAIPYSFELPLPRLVREGAASFNTRGANQGGTAAGALPWTPPAPHAPMKGAGCSAQHAPCLPPSLKRVGGCDGQGRGGQKAAWQAKGADFPWLCVCLCLCGRALLNASMQCRVRRGRGEGGGARDAAHRRARVRCMPRQGGRWLGRIGQLGGGFGQSERQRSSSLGGRHG